MKLPAFQFYPADWRKDPGIQALSRHDQSVWFDILCLMHESEERGVLLLAGKPMPVEALGHILRLDKQEVNQILSTLLTYGVASKREEDGAIYNRRMVRDERLIQIRRKAGKKGGNPNLVKQNPKQKQTTQVKQNPTPSSSSSSSTTDNKKEAEELYQIYPLKKSRVSALKAIEKALTKVDFETIKTGIENYKLDLERTGSLIAHCSTWMNQERWEDDPTPELPKVQHSKPQAQRIL
jgi:hypothetical protein